MHGRARIKFTKYSRQTLIVIRWVYKYTTFHVTHILYICFEDWMIYCCQLDGKCTQFISLSQDTTASTEPLIYKDLQRSFVHWCTEGSCCWGLFILLKQLLRACFLFFVDCVVISYFCLGSINYHSSSFFGIWCHCWA